MQLTHREYPKYTVAIPSRLPTTGNPEVQATQPNQEPHGNWADAVNLTVPTPAKSDVLTGDQRLRPLLGNLSLLEGDDISLDVLLHPNVNANLRYPLAQHAIQMQQQRKMQKTVVQMELALETAWLELETAKRDLDNAPDDIKSKLKSAAVKRQSHVDRLIHDVEAAHAALTVQQTVVQTSQAWLVKRLSNEDSPKPPGIEPVIVPLDPPRDVVVPSPLRPPFRFAWSTGLAAGAGVILLSTVGLQRGALELGLMLAAMFAIGLIVDYVEWVFGNAG